MSQYLSKKIIQENKRLFIQKELYPKILIPEDYVTHTDSKWLSFMIEQLILNAVKYSYEQTTITIRLDQDTLSIVDEGIGIAEQDLPRVMNAFYTGSNGRLFGESTGMGLYLVKNLAKKLSMGVEVQSKLGVGTIAQLKLHVKRKDE